MNKITMTTFGLCALGLCANTALAATISVLPASTDVSINSPLTMTIEGDDFTQSVNAVGVTVSWNPDILEYSGITLGTPWDTSFINDINAADGVIDTIFVTSFDGIDPDFLLAEIAFTALSVGSSDITIETSGDGCVAGSCGVFSGDDQDPILADYTQAQVNVVPIPAAAWLFLSGVLGLIGFSRRK
jgi:hypothetical protein